MIDPETDETLQNKLSSSVNFSWCKILLGMFYNKL